MNRSLLRVQNMEIGVTVYAANVLVQVGGRFHSAYFFVCKCHSECCGVADTHSGAVLDWFAKSKRKRHKLNAIQRRFIQELIDARHDHAA